MSKSGSVADIWQVLAEYEKTADSVSLELKLSLAEILCRHLRRTGLDPPELARRTGLTEAYIVRLLHSDANCSLDTAGRLLHALGIRARLQEERR